MLLAVNQLSQKATKPLATHMRAGFILCRYRMDKAHYFKLMLQQHEQWNLGNYVDSSLTAYIMHLTAQVPRVELYVYIYISTLSNCPCLILQHHTCSSRNKRAQKKLVWAVFSIELLLCCWQGVWQGHPSTFNLALLLSLPSLNWAFFGLLFLHFSLRL